MRLSYLPYEYALSLISLDQWSVPPRGSPYQWYCEPLDHEFMAHLNLQSSGDYPFVILLRLACQVHRESRGLEGGLQAEATMSSKEKTRRELVVKWT